MQGVTEAGCPDVRRFASQHPVVAGPVVRSGVLGGDQDRSLSLEDRGLVVPRRRPEVVVVLAQAGRDQLALRLHNLLIHHWDF